RCRYHTADGDQRDAGQRRDRCRHGNRRDGDLQRGDQRRDAHDDHLRAARPGQRRRPRRGQLQRGHPRRHADAGGRARHRAVVPATVSYNAATRVGTLTPSAGLSASKTYTATITGGSGGVKDLAGNALASDVVWSFTTASVTVGLTTIGGTLDSGDSGYLNG